MAGAVANRAIVAWETVYLLPGAFTRLCRYTAVAHPWINAIILLQVPSVSNSYNKVVTVQGTRAMPPVHKIDDVPSGRQRSQKDHNYAHKSKSSYNSSARSMLATRLILALIFQAWRVFRRRTSSKHLLQLPPHSVVELDMRYRYSFASHHAW